ncbi:MAG: 1-deoxy-D-xylulose-5-phosphate synthase [Acidimicrobiales bacterium]
MLLDQINEPRDLRRLDAEQLTALAEEIREFIVGAVTKTGGHLGSNLGVVELTLALHRVFDSPRDIILWDTGHQAYIHKLLTGRRDDFVNLRQQDGLSGYPSRRESEHDWIENSHASTALSYAHGLSTALQLQGEDHRHVVAVLGDGSLTGGMAYEALNNLGHAGSRVVIILNDNGRSYSPTVSKLATGLTNLRLSPSYIHARERLRKVLREIPALGALAYSGAHGLTVALREVVTPHRFFEALGIRYVGPVDGHDVLRLEADLARAAEWDGPILLHVLTQKGRGYPPAEDDEVQNLHDFKVPASAPPVTNGNGSGQEIQEAGVVAPLSYSDAFTRSMLDIAKRRKDVFAITAAMAGPTGLLPFQARYPDRFLDVGIAEQHAVTAAAGMAMAGLRPVVAVYSTFFTRAFDQANLDVGLHRLPVVFFLDRAGITGDDGPSHHGVLDLALTLSIPGMTVFAPSSAEEVPLMLEQALSLEGPSAIRVPKTPARHAERGAVGSGMSARLVHHGDGSVCILAVGKMVEVAENAAKILATEGVDATVWDARVISPPDAHMLADAVAHSLVVTVEDGIRVGGAGTFVVDAMRSMPELDRPLPPVRMLGLPLDYIPQGKPDVILAKLGLDAAGVARSVTTAMTTEQSRLHMA